MAAAEVTLSGTLYDRLNRTTQQVVFIGDAMLTGVGIGGGPMPGGPGLPGGPVDPGYSPPWAQIRPPVDPGYSPPWAQVPVDPPTEPPPTQPPPADSGHWVWGWSPQQYRWMWVKVPGEGEAGPKSA